MSKDTDNIDKRDSTKIKEKRSKKRKHEARDTIDLVDDSAAEKKKKKRESMHENSVTDIAVSEAAPGEVETGKKSKKKRKHHEQNEPALSTSEDAVPRKEKKHKKVKKDKNPAPDSSASSPASNPSSYDSAVKKVRKGRESDETALSVSITSSSSTAEISDFLLKNSITVSDPDVVPVLSFSQLSLPPAFSTAFSSFKAPTPIQACTWPPALAGRDVVGIAETGSGKTYAFGIPLLSRLIFKRETRETKQKEGVSTVTALVVAPTRELAVQTHDALSALGASLGIASVAVFGGVPKEPQVRMLRNADKATDGRTTRIIVGTPGRILDLAQEGVCDLSNVDYLVLDEADRMLDKGFENDIRNIIGQTKQGGKRQTLMFSATWPESVRRLASTFQKNPVRVTVGSDDLTANSCIEQVVEVLDDSRQKDARLSSLLKSFDHKKGSQGKDNSRILVFALYKKEASRVEMSLKRQGYSVDALHGDMSQTARMDALEKFKNGTTSLLVATDVAARGLDIPNVAVVINYTFPLTIEDYIHRIGRTGRGGRSGKSVTFFTGENHERSLAGELARVLHDGGFECEGLKKFPMTIKKREHSVYGAFYRDDIKMPKQPTRLVFT